VREKNGKGKNWRGGKKGKNEKIGGKSELH
jgi:hypothetical protein